MKIKKGDTVQIILGNDAGKTGRIIKVFPSREKIIVEGLNMVKKHVKTTKEKKGGIVSKESFIHISNLKLINDKVKNKKVEAKK